MFIRQLKYLASLDAYRSFSKAAEYCGVSQPALSMAIRQLEEELGVTIVHRRPRAVGFTKEGERILLWAKQTIVALEGLREEAEFSKTAEKGRLSISVMPPVIQTAPLLLDSLRSAVPGLQIDITVSPHQQILEDLKEHKTQLGIVYLESLTDNKLFQSQNLYDEHYMLVAPPEISLARKKYGWCDLSEIPLSLLKKEMRSRQIIDECFQKNKITPNIVLETNSLEILYREIRSGRSASILPAGSLPYDHSDLNRYRVISLTSYSSLTVGLIRLHTATTTHFMSKIWETASRFDLGSFPAL
ncbi:LysR family transcriptional regulator [Gluconobacter cerinus]|uniref:LysR family transcriptional regulator n=1 Tax=Gluconobacter cerinus TaxID=38307 RepID=UPI001B8BE470|nr:LysR substrate-binding domain-containing protein [Gluconobacter cerinus]MBS1038554.1 LysR family transcriptional regulator [Gluconobacter cerinus]